MHTRAYARTHEHARPRCQSHDGALVPLLVQMLLRHPDRGARTPKRTSLDVPRTRVRLSIDGTGRPQRASIDDPRPAQR
eukprot:294377-Chlamydomonas_euryale.AAC.1